MSHYKTLLEEHICYLQLMQQDLEAEAERLKTAPFSFANTIMHTGTNIFQGQINSLLDSYEKMHGRLERYERTIIRDNNLEAEIKKE